VFIAEQEAEEFISVVEKKAQRWVIWGVSTGESLAVLRRSQKEGVLQPKRTPRPRKFL